MSVLSEFLWLIPSAHSSNKVEMLLIRRSTNGCITVWSFRYFIEMLNENISLYINTLNLFSFKGYFVS